MIIDSEDSDMPKPSQRSRSLRRAKRTTPGGRKMVHYSKRKKVSARCSSCGNPLQGVNSNGKVPGRVYGGQLCASCARVQIKADRLADFGY